MNCLSRRAQITHHTAVVRIVRRGATRARIAACLWVWPAGQVGVQSRHMPSVVVSERTNQRVAIGDLGQKRQVLANLNPGDVRYDWAERAPRFRRSVRLQVKRLDVRRSAVEADKQHLPRLAEVLRSRAGGRREIECRTPPKRQGAQATDAQHLAPSDVVTQASRIA